jgi:hypothetical protein
MNDQPLQTLIIAAINAGLTERAVSGIAVKMGYQPTAQGVPSGPAIYLHKVADWPYGYPQFADVYNGTPGFVTHTETQRMITTYQLNASVLLDPSNANALTASDLVNLARDILQTQTSIVSLRSSGVAVFRITAGRQTFFVDDKGRFEGDPSYDCSFQHSRITSYAIPSTKVIKGIVQKVPSIYRNRSFTDAFTSDFS